MYTALLWGLGMGTLVALMLLIIYLPARVQYVLTVSIDAPVARIYDAIRYQTELMTWSPWPVETQSNCMVRNPDGELGAQTVYLKNGKEYGYQEIIELVPNLRVGFFLKSYVAPFEKDVRLTFLLLERAEQPVEVYLFFDEHLQKPQFLIAYFAGILKWVYQMHQKDLQALKAYVETKQSA